MEKQNLDLDSLSSTTTNEYFLATPAMDLVNMGIQAQAGEVRPYHHISAPYRNHIPAEPSDLHRRTVDIPGDPQHLQDGRVVFSDGGTIFPNGNFRFPDGTMVSPDGVMVFPNGHVARIDPSGLNARTPTPPRHQKQAHARRPLGESRRRRLPRYLQSRPSTPLNPHSSSFVPKQAERYPGEYQTQQSQVFHSQNPNPYLAQQPELYGYQSRQPEVQQPEQTAEYQMAYEQFLVESGQTSEQETTSESEVSAVGSASAHPSKTPCDFCPRGSECFCDLMFPNEDNKDCPCPICTREKN